MASNYQTLAQSVAAHDAQIGSLAQSVASLAATTEKRFGELADTMDTGFKELREDLKSSARSQRTNWGTIAAWAAVIITLGGGLFVFIEQRIDAERRLTAQRFEMLSELSKEQRNSFIMLLDSLRQEHKELGLIVQRIDRDLVRAKTIVTESK